MTVQQLVAAPPIWDQLSERHHKMVRATVKLLESEAVLERLDIPLWEMLLEELRVIADTVRDGHGSIRAVEDVIERGYRRLLFANNPDIHAAEELGEDQVFPYGAEEIDQVLSEYDDE